MNISSIRLAKANATTNLTVRDATVTRMKAAAGTAAVENMMMEMTKGLCLRKSRNHLKPRVL
jgi:hypothetical protein